MRPILTSSIEDRSAVVDVAAELAPSVAGEHARKHIGPTIAATFRGSTGLFSSNVEPAGIRDREGSTVQAPDA